MAEKRVGPEFDGTTVLPDPNLEIGIDFDLWSRDRSGFRTSRDMVTGGVATRFGCYAGPEVGEQYQGALGEDRTETSYPGGSAMDVISEHTGMSDIEGPVKAGSFGNEERTAMSGKSRLRAPQNYRIFGGKQHR